MRSMNRTDFGPLPLHDMALQSAGQRLVSGREIDITHQPRELTLVRILDERVHAKIKVAAKDVETHTQKERNSAPR